MSGVYYGMYCEAYILVERMCHNRNVRVGEMKTYRFESDYFFVSELLGTFYFNIK